MARIYKSGFELNEVGHDLNVSLWDLIKNTFFPKRYKTKLPNGMVWCDTCRSNNFTVDIDNNIVSLRCPTCNEWKMRINI
jgi:hypothetical protein